MDSVRMGEYLSYAQFKTLDMYLQAILRHSESSDRSSQLPSISYTTALVVRRHVLL